MRYILAIGLLATSTLLVGCGTPEATNVVESADKSKIAEYEAMVAADSASMNASMGANPEGAAEPAEPEKK